MEGRGYTTSDSRKYLASGDILAAIIRTAADLEALLFEKLFFEKDINPELIEKWTLGRYLEWNLKLNLIDKNSEPILREFLTLRNRCVHHRVYIERIQINQNQLNEVKNLLKKVLDFIDVTFVLYNSTPEKEMQYDRHMNKKM